MARKRRMDEAASSPILILEASFLFSRLGILLRILKKKSCQKRKSICTVIELGVDFLSFLLVQSKNNRKLMLFLSSTFFDFTELLLRFCSKWWKNKIGFTCNWTRQSKFRSKLTNVSQKTDFKVIIKLHANR